MGVFGGADAGSAGPAASAGGSAPACWFWNPGPALRSIPLSACLSSDAVGGPSGLATLYAMRRTIAAEVHRRLVSLAATGTASGGCWRGAGGGRHPLGKGQAVERRSRDAGCRGSLRRVRSTGGWQDSCAVHDSRCRTASAPGGKMLAQCIPQRRSAGAFRMHGAHILPKLAVFEYMQAICCHEVALFPSEAPSGTHRDDFSPRPAARGTHQSDISLHAGRRSPPKFIGRPISTVMALGYRVKIRHWHRSIGKS